jgi:hypothetical protein
MYVHLKYKVHVYTYLDLIPSITICDYFKIQKLLKFERLLDPSIFDKEYSAYIITARHHILISPLH